MRISVKAVFLAVLFLASVPVQAEMRRIQPGSGITAVAMDAAEGLRTFTVAKLKGSWQRLTIGVSYVKGAGGDATSATVTCTGSMDAGVTFKKVTATAVVAGVGTVTPYGDDYPLAGGDEGFFIGYDIVNLDQIKCVVGGTGTTATHTITVQLSLSVVQ